MLEFSDVILGLKKGKAYKRLVWEDGAILIVKGANFGPFVVHTELGDYRPSTADMLAGDWIEVLP